MAKIEAYRLRPVREVRLVASIDGDTKGRLPTAFCSSCNSSASFSELRFPTLWLNDEEAQLSKLKRKIEQRDVDGPLRSPVNGLLPSRVRKDLDWGEWIEFQSNLLTRLNKSIALWPGSGWGPFTGTTPRKQLEVIWLGSSLPLFSAEALDKLRGSQFCFPSIEANIKCRGRSPKRYFIVEPPAAQVLSDLTIEQQDFRQCSFCKQCEPRGLKGISPGEWEVSLDRWPSDSPVVQSTSFGGWFVSDEFYRRAMELNIEGLGFEKVGIWA